MSSRGSKAQATMLKMLAISFSAIAIFLPCGAAAQVAVQTLLPSESNSNFVAVADPSINEVAAKEGRLFTVPLAYARSGRLQSEVVSPEGRLSADTIVHAFSFTNSRSEGALSAWCGLGSANPNRVPRTPITMCIVFTPDGRARIQQAVQPYELPPTPAGIFPYAFYPSTSDAAANYIQRPTIKSVPQVTSSFQFEYAYRSIGENVLYLKQRLIGAGSREMKSYGPRFEEVALTNGAAKLIIGKQMINLTVEGDAVRSIVDVANGAQERGPETSQVPQPSQTLPNGVDRPSLRPRRFVIQGMLLDPSRLTPSTSPIVANGQLAVLPASWWQTGTLPNGLKVKDGLDNFDAPPGTRLYRVETFTPGPLMTRSAQTFWCGDMAKNIWGGSMGAQCIDVIGDRGFILQTTLAEAFAADLREPLSTKVIRASQTQVIEDSSPISTQFQIVVKLKGIKRDSINVEIVVLDGNKSQPILRLDVPRLANTAIAQLPLWSHVLELRVEADQRSVTARLISEEVGLGPVDLRLLGGQQISTWTGRGQ